MKGLNRFLKTFIIYLMLFFPPKYFHNPSAVILKGAAETNR